MSWPSKVFSGNLVSIGLLESENWSDDLDIYHICLWTKYAYAVEIYQAVITEWVIQLKSDIDGNKLNDLWWPWPLR